MPGLIFITDRVFPLVPFYGVGKWGSEDVYLPDIVGSEWQSCNLNPGLSTLELELELTRALLYSHEDRDCVFP